jgi:hypothetical protein
MLDLQQNDLGRADHRVQQGHLLLEHVVGIDRGLPPAEGAEMKRELDSRCGCVRAALRRLVDEGELFAHRHRVPLPARRPIYLEPVAIAAPRLRVGRDDLLGASRRGQREHDNECDEKPRSHGMRFRPHGIQS